MNDNEWLRSGKWHAFYSGAFSPHLPQVGITAESAIKYLPWRTLEPSEQLIEYVSSGYLPPDSHCCELGCGTGENCAFLASRTASVVGVDIVPAAVAASTQVLRAAGLMNGKAVCADILGMLGQLVPFGGDNCGWGEFDFLLDVQTFQCLRKVDAALAARVYEALLRPGSGKLLLLTGNADEATERGPERLTKAEVLGSFDGTSLVCEDLQPFRFEWTATYQRQEHAEPPLGWRSTWRRTRPGE